MWSSPLKCIMFCACLQVCEYIKIIDLAENSALAFFNLSGFVSQQKIILSTENADNNEFVYMSMRGKKSFIYFHCSLALLFYYLGYKLHHLR